MESATLPFIVKMLGVTAAVIQAAAREANADNDLLLHMVLSEQLADVRRTESKMFAIMAAVQEGK